MKCVIFFCLLAFCVFEADFADGIDDIYKQYIGLVQDAQEQTKKQVTDAIAAAHQKGIKTGKCESNSDDRITDAYRNAVNQTVQCYDSATSSKTMKTCSKKALNALNTGLKSASGYNERCIAYCTRNKNCTVN